MTTGTAGLADCGNPLSCIIKKDSGNPETATVTGVAGTTYYIILDAYSATGRGDYTVVVN